MKAADPKEAIDIALFDAQRLVRDLRQISPDALGIGGSVTHYHERDAAIAAVSRVVVLLEEAKAKLSMKEPTE